MTAPQSTDQRLCTIHKTPCDHWVRCHRCQGHGTLMYHDDDEGDDTQVERDCPDCGGHGGTEECEFCHEESLAL